MKYWLKETLEKFQQIAKTPGVTVDFNSPAIMLVSRRVQLSNRPSVFDLCFMPQTGKDAVVAFHAILANHRFYEEVVDEFGDTRKMDDFREIFLNSHALVKNDQNGVDVIGPIADLLPKPETTTETPTA